MLANSKTGHTIQINMKHLSIGLRMLFIAVLVVAGYGNKNVLAESNGLVIVQAKITTGSQFITLYNNSDVATNSSFQLNYYNNSDRSKATSSKVLNVANVVPARGYYIFNDGQLDLCQQAKIDSVSLGFSTTSGSVELVRLDGGTSSTVSVLKWVSKSATDGVQLLPSSVAGYDSFLQYDLASSSWSQVQTPVGSPCAVQKVLASNMQSSTLSGGQAPSVNVITLAQSSSAKNDGLKAPIINELLPNPKSPQTDADDEFVEIYNPNDKEFSLSGYELGWGKSTISTYAFEEGVVIPAKTYAVFTSSETSLSLSNTGSQVFLIDPSGNTISQSAAYSSAKDGEAWSLVNGEWKWLMQASPGIVNDGVLSGSEESSLNVSPNASITSDANNATNNSSGAGNTAKSEDDVLPLHPTVLAGIGLSAVGYGVYEYRRDIANRIFQLRRYFKLRRQARAELPGRGNILISK